MAGVQCSGVHAVRRCWGEEGIENAYVFREPCRMNEREKAFLTELHDTWGYMGVAQNEAGEQQGILNANPKTGLSPVGNNELSSVWGH